MWPQPYGRGRGFLERVVGSVLVVLVGVLAVQALIMTISPWLPWIGLAIVLSAALAGWNARRNRW